MGLAATAAAQPAPAPQAKNHTVSGTVRDAKNGEALPGLTVSVRQGTKLYGATSNAYGFYSLSVPPAADSVLVSFTYVGYVAVTRKVLLDKDITLNAELAEEGTQLEEIVISDERLVDAVNSTQMSSTRMNIAQIKRVPVIFGEVDLMKVIQFLPGIKTGTEATAGFYVRGGGSDQNLILLDEAIVYNAAHLGGLFSVFNPDAVKGLEVYKGNFPANFGGRLSSVLDVQLKEGNRKKFGISGGLGLISSRLTLEGPINKGKGSWIISGRRTYFDLFTNLVNQANRNDPNFNPIPAYYFYDLNLKANYDLGVKDRLFLSGYFGRDVFGFTGQNGGFSFNFYWGNVTATLRWNHIFNDKLFSNTSITYSDYRYNIDNSIANFSFNLFSRIEDVSARVDFDWYPNPRHSVKFGLQAINHTFTPSGFSIENAAAGVSTNFLQRIGGNEGAVYISDDFDITERLRANVGLRASGFIGSRRDTVARYGGLEPRASARYKISDNWAVKASYARMYQYVHLASSSTASLPTDVWYPSTNRAAPQYSDQVAIGITKIIPKWGVSITSETYYKWLYNQIELRNGANIFANANVDQEFAFGTGTSYGTELLIEKKEGRFTGWIGYTLSWSWRKFRLDPEQLGPEEVFPFRFDRRHDISLVAMYDISKRALITLSFVYRTGDAVTVPQNRVIFSDLPGVRKQGFVGGQFFPGGIVPNYGPRNSFRMPDTHRMDVSFTWKFRPKRGESDITISIYNLYNQRNPFFFYIDPQNNSQGAPTSFQAKVVALFPTIPSVTYNFKF
jgi:hypothetical protein